jgi:hypothetical protein
VGTVRVLYRASTISLQAAVYPEHTFRALNMKEEDPILNHTNTQFFEDLF